MKTLLTFFTITLLASCGQGEAENSAKKFAAQHFPQHTSVTCVSGMGADSDDDGYVSCTVILPDDAIAIECATEHLGACGQKGCRMATGKGPGRL